MKRGSWTYRRARKRWQALDRNIRQQVRMARRNGLVVEIDRSGSRLGDLYAVLSGSPMRRARPYSAVISWSMLWSSSREHNMALVYSDGNPIAGYFQLEMGDACYGVWGAALHEYLELRPVYLAYWELLADTTAWIQAVGHGEALATPTPRSTRGNGTANRFRSISRWLFCAADKRREAWRPAPSPIASSSWCAVFGRSCLTRLLSFGTKAEASCTLRVSA